MKIKTSELQGAALDYAVAVAEGFGPDTYMRNIDIRKDVKGKCSMLQVPINRQYCAWRPSTDWSQGGPIIEREFISIFDLPSGLDIQAHPNFKAGDLWESEIIPQGEDSIRYCGQTPLIAAMRCYLASKLGEEVEVPNELA